MYNHDFKVRRVIVKAKPAVVVHSTVSWQRFPQGTESSIVGEAFVVAGEKTVQSARPVSKAARSLKVA
jgi:hypothetical protein